VAPRPTIDEGGIVKPHRLPVFVVIVLALGGLALAGHNETEQSRADVVANQALMPMTSSAGAVSSSFFCAGGTASPDGAFDSTIIIANPNADEITTTLTVYPAAAPGDANGQAAVATLKPVVKQVTVGPRTRTGVRLASVQQSPFAAALVETNDPGIAVEHTIVTKQGVNASPCASAPSRTWYMPTGTTTRDAHELLAIFNPFAADAVVDVTYQTNDGFRSPGSEQGLPIMAGHVQIVDVTADVPRLEQLAAFVTARAGQVVVDRLQVFDGTDPNHPPGAAATLGAPQPAAVWSFPHGQASDTVRETFTVVNPGNEPAQAQLEVVLDDPATNGVVDPIPVTVPPRGYAQVALQDQTRVPKGIGHTVTVRSIAGPGVVADRVISLAASAGRQGYAPALGSPLLATRWLFADGGAVPNTIGESLAVFNPSTDETARISITALAQGQAIAIDGLQSVEVLPGARLALDLGQHLARPDLPVIAETTLPVVIERSYVVNGGLSFAVGMPMPETASIPPSTVPKTTTTVPGPN
jgi:hypothetical protein